MKRSCWLCNLAVLSFCMALNLSASAKTTDATVGTIKPAVPAPQLIGTPFTVEVTVGAVQKLFGASFELRYTNPALVKIVAPAGSNVTAGPFLGSDVIFFANLDTTAGRIGVGISRKSGQAAVSGSGVLARITFRSPLATPNNTSVTFSLHEVTANDSLGNSISLAASDSTMKLLGLLVYPGDTNNDKIVNQADVLPIGLYFNKTGPVRPNASLAFTGQMAFPWAAPEASTYADANGNGVVNQADVLVLGLNWAKTHNGPARMIEPPVLSKNAPVRLSTAIIGERRRGEEFYVEVRAEGADNLFGAAFELIYSRASCEPLTVEPAGWMGDDILFLPNVDRAAGKISVGLTRKSGQRGVDGSGALARIKMRAIGSEENFPFALQNGVANNPAGHLMPVRMTGSSIAAAANDGSLPAAFALHASLPNPLRLSAHAATMIHYDLPATAETRLEIYDLLGQHVRTLVQQQQPAGRHSVAWNGRDEQGRAVAAGVFLYRLRVADPVTGGTGNFVQSRKLMVLQ